MTQTPVRARAEQGDAEAQSSLGLMYPDGRDVPQDLAEANASPASGTRRSGDVRDTEFRGSPMLGNRAFVVKFMRLFRF